MKAWILEKQDKIENKPLMLVDNYPDPEPGEGQIRIKVKYVGICRTDIHIAESDLPLHKKPLILGHEIAGIVDKIGGNVSRFKIGDKVGLTWLYKSCGGCEYCINGRENYCPHFTSTGWDADGGYAEYVVAYENYAIPLNNAPLDLSDLAPLMCPGVASYMCLEYTNPKPGDKMGIIGFGPTAYYLLKIASSVGVDVYVSTRSKHHQELAYEYGARWVGNILEEDFPEKLDHIVSFPPVGEVVERALKNLKPGGDLILAQIASTPIVINNYPNLWGRTIKTIYNVNRRSAYGILGFAKKIDLSIEKELIDFEDIQDYMILARKGQIDKLTIVARVG